MSFESQPELRGETINVRPLAEDDFDKLYAVASDAMIWEQHPASDRYQEKVFREFFREAMESGGALVVIELVTDRVIGSSRYHAFSEQDRSVEIGWTFLAREYWGGKYNGELKHLMLTHAFQFVDRVEFVIGSENLRSQKAVRKIGASYSHMRDEGNCVFALNRDSFLAGRPEQVS